ncbi:hypothetical protein, unknown function, partial [Leishmania donovani]
MTWSMLRTRTFLRPCRRRHCRVAIADTPPTRRSCTARTCTGSCRRGTRRSLPTTPCITEGEAPETSMSRLCTTPLSWRGRGRRRRSSCRTCWSCTGADDRGGRTRCRRRRSCWTTSTAAAPHRCSAGTARTCTGSCRRGTRRSLPTTPCITEGEAPETSM